MQSKRLFASSTSRAAFSRSPSSIAWMAFSTSPLARVTPLSLLVARKVRRRLEMLPNISNTDEAPLGIALGFELIDGNPLGDREGTPDSEGAPLGTVLGFALIEGKILGIKDGTPDAEEGASLGWGRCVW